MRIFNKMKKVLLVAAALFTVNGAFAESKTVNYIQNDKDNVPGAETVNVSLDAISFSYLGDANGWDVKSNKQSYSGNSYTHYVSGKSNPTVTDGVPTAGSVMGFVPQYDGQIALCMVLNKGKSTFVLEDGVGLSTDIKVDGKWNDGSVADTAFTSGGKMLRDKVYGTLTFDVKANKQYYVYCTGSKMGYYGFSYTYDDAPAVEPEVPAADSLKLGETNILEVGKTYIIGKSGQIFKVQFTAEKDGFFYLTPNQKVSSTGLKINNSSSTFTKDANGGVDKKGMAAGSVFFGQYYINGEPSAENTYSFTVSFEEGVPYSPLALTEALPANGAEWSGAADYYTTYYKGQAYYDFSSAINTTDVVASIKIGEEVFTPVKVTSVKNGVRLNGMPEIMSAAVAEGKIKAGETFTVTLSNIKDKEFAVNTLADQTFTYTLASTACTGVKSDASTNKLPTYVTFSFDGAVKIDAAKFYYVNMFTGETMDLTAEVVDGTSVKITGPVIEGLPSRQYKIVAENVTDENGKAISYSSDENTYPKEDGKLIYTKALNNALFNNNTKATLSLDNWDGYTQVYSLKSFSITYPVPVVLNPDVTTPIIFKKVVEQSGGGDIDWWSEGEVEGGEGGEATEAEITVSHAISETDPCTVIFTLSQEVTDLGQYSFEIPSKLYWAKEYYTAGDDAKNNSFGYYSPTTYAYAEIVEPMMTDVTDKLVNPGFEASATEGWTAGSKGTQYGTSGDAQKLKDGLMFAGNIVEHWESNDWSGDIAQTVTDLPAGYYKFTFCAYVNKAGEAYVFANESLSDAIVNGQVGKYSVVTYLEEGAALKVGFKNVSGINWICLDNAHLYYYGDCPEELLPVAELNAVKVTVDKLILSATELKASYANPIEVEALDAVIAAVKTETIEECEASITALEKAIAEFKAVNDAEIAYQTLAATLAGATAENPVDATGFMTNPSFEAGSVATGWTTSWTSSSGWANHKVVENIANPHDGKNGFETWSPLLSSVDMHQEVRLPAGSYVASAALRTEFQGQITDQHVYVKVGEEVLSSEPLQPFTATWNSYEGWQVLSVAFTLDSEGKVTIGAASSSDGTNDPNESKGWFQIDNFRISCVGWIDPALAPAVDSLKALIVEATELKASLNAADEAHAQVIGMIDQMIPAAQAIVDAPESTAAVNEMISSVYMFLYQTKIQLAQYDAQMAQALMGTYENPTDEAGFEAAITQVFVISNGLMMGEGSYTLDQLTEAVAAMKAAQEAFIVENTPEPAPELGDRVYDFSRAAWGGHTEDLTVTEGTETVETIDGIGVVTVTIGDQLVEGFLTQGNIGFLKRGSADGLLTMKGPRTIAIQQVKAGQVVTWYGKEQQSAFTLTLVENGVATADETNTTAGSVYTYNVVADGTMAVRMERYAYIDSITVVTPVAPSFDLTAYNDTVAWANEIKATLNPEDETEAEVIVAIDDYLASAAQWLEETLADPEATQADVDFIAVDLKAAVGAVVARIQIMKMWPEVDAIRAEGDSILMLYPEVLRTDEAGLVVALQSLPRVAMWVTSVEELQTAMDAVKAAVVPFQQENNANLADSANVAVAGAEEAVAQYPNADATGLTAAAEAVKTILAANETTSTEYPVADVLATLDALAAAQAAFIEDTKYVKSDLTKEMFLNWDGVGADAQPTAEVTNPDYNVGVEIGAGGMLYGYSTVYYLSYADLTGAVKMILEGTPGMQLRILMNRVENEGALTEVNVTIGENGKAVVDFAGMEYVHLNAIKAGWGSAAGTVTKVTLVKPYVEEVPEGPTVAYLCGATETTEDIYTALVAAGYNVTPLNYDDVVLTEDIIASDFVGKYDVVVLAGGTGSSANLAKSANLLVGKVNVLSTKSFWYKHYGTNGENPGTAATPSLSLVKSAAYVEHPIYAGIEGDEFAVFNDMAKENGRYLQSNGSFAEGPEQVTLGTTLGADCIGEAWSNGFGYVIVPVDGAQPEGYLTEDGKALFVNIVEYLINGEQYVSGIADVTINGAQWPADIYDVNGRMVKKAATSLEGLQKGLYFVNGKKMLVK